MNGVATMTELPPLAQLVKQRHDAGRSYRDMSKDAQRAGRAISHSQLAEYAKDGIRKAPTHEQMEALSAALGVSFERVYAAAIEQFYGYVPQSLGNNRGNAVSAAVPFDLSPEEEEELARLVRAWVAARRATES